MDGYFAVKVRRQSVAAAAALILGQTLAKTSAQNRPVIISIDASVVKIAVQVHGILENLKALSKRKRHDERWTAKIQFLGKTLKRDHKYCETAHTVKVKAVKAWLPAQLKIHSKSQFS